MSVSRSLPFLLSLLNMLSLPLPAVPAVSDDSGTTCCHCRLLLAKPSGSSAPAQQLPYPVSVAQVQAAGISVISPEMALSAYVRWSGAAAQDMRIRALEYSSGDGTSELYYVVAPEPQVRTEPGVPTGGRVDARTGEVVLAYYQGAPTPDSLTSDRSGPISFEHAQKIATDWLHAHYPPFAAGEWVRAPRADIDIGRNYQFSTNYQFSWRQVLGPYRALVGAALMVDVQPWSGLVTGFDSPPRSINLAAIRPPRISFATAVALAQRYCPVDPRLSPVIVVLNLGGTPATGYTLGYSVAQRLRPGDPFPEPVMYIGAYNGLVQPGPDPLGGNAPALRGHPPLVAPIAHLVTATGSRVYPQGGLLDVAGVQYVAPQTLRQFGAQVAITTQGVTVSGNAHALHADGARLLKRDGVWWVPVRATAEALGWRVDWIAAGKKIVITTDAASAAHAKDPLFILAQTLR